MVSGSGNSHIGTLVARTSRFAQLVRLEKKTTDCAIAALTAKIQKQRKPSTCTTASSATPRCTPPLRTSSHASLTRTHADPPATSDEGHARPSRRPGSPRCCVAVPDPTEEVQASAFTSYTLTSWISTGSSSPAETMPTIC